jgi:hypothetical protein
MIATSPLTSSFTSACNQLCIRPTVVDRDGTGRISPIVALKAHHWELASGIYLIMAHGFREDLSVFQMN